MVGEKRDAHWSYLGERGYMPMLGFVCETPVCLVEEFREGNVSPGTGQLDFYRPCRTRRPVGKRLARYRADRASYQAALINELEADHVQWAITADQDVAVKAVIAGGPTEAWQEPEKGGGDPVAEAVHTMNQTKAAVRLSLTREERLQGDRFEKATGPYAYHVVASNGPVEEKTAHAGLRGHNQRGQAETFPQALKHGLGLEPLPCGESGAKAVFFRIGVLAYNLFIGFTRLACPAAWASQTIATVRWKLVPGAGRILRHAGRVVLRLVLDAEALACWRTIRQRCGALGVAPGRFTRSGKQRGVSGTPGSVCLHSPSHDQEGTTGPGSAMSHDPGHETHEARRVTIRLQAPQPSCAEFLSLDLGVAIPL